MTSNKELIALQFSFDENDYEANLHKLLSLIRQCPKNSVVVAPELCLTHFSFDALEVAADFGQIALPAILQESHGRVICFTMVESIDGHFYNVAKILHDGVVVHSQPKVKLFKLGNEEKFFSPGDEDSIKIIEINGLKYAVLICFEIRFTELWERIRGADILMIPALWGKIRKEHFESITQALAIINQAFVIASDSANEDMASSSGIITPFGVTYRDDESDFISIHADLSEIKKMRRYLDVGLS